MAIKACNTQILVDRWALSGNSNNAELEISADALEYNVFQTCVTQSIPDVPATKLTHNGYFSAPTTGELEQVMYARLADAGDAQVSLILGTDQTIPVGYVLEGAYNGQLKIDGQAKSLITVAGLWQARDVQLYRGYRLWSGSISATGPQAGIDFGALGVAGGRAWIHIVFINGATTDATIAVESDDNAGFTPATSRGTFTFSIVGSNAIALADVERYMRINTTDLGGATSFTVTVIAGASGITY